MTERTTNVGPGMAPCRKGCRCDDCEIERLQARARIAEQEAAELVEALDAALSMIEHSLTGLTNPDTGSVYRKGVDDLALNPDGSMTLLKARAILAKHKAEGREG